MLEGDTGSTPAETSTPTETEPEYELNLSPFQGGDTVDLSSLPLEPTEYTEDDIWTDYSFELEYEVLRDGEPVNPENVSIESVELGGYEPEYDSGENRIAEPCTEAGWGENTFLLEATAEGETLRVETVLEKKTPDNYRVEPFVNGEPLTPGYSTVFQFDTHNLDTEEFYEERDEIIEKMTHDDILDYIDRERLNNILEDDSLSEVERKRKAMASIGYDVNEAVGKSSATAEYQAANEESVFRELTEYEEVYQGGFHNPNDLTIEGGGNHGSKVAYIDGDWYHHETINPEVVHVNNLERMDMMQPPEDSNNGEYVSVLGEYEEGNMREVGWPDQVTRSNALLFTTAIPTLDVSIKDAVASYNFGLAALEMIRDNESWEDVMRPVELTADHVLETGAKMTVFGTPAEPKIFVSGNRDLHKAVINNPDKQSVETAREMLS